jgi:hypothetical protein
MLNMINGPKRSQHHVHDKVTFRVRSRSRFRIDRVAEMCNRKTSKKVRLRLRLRLVVNYAKNRLRLRLCNRLEIRLLFRLN